MRWGTYLRLDLAHLACCHLLSLKAWPTLNFLLHGRIVLPSHVEIVWKCWDIDCVAAVLFGDGLVNEVVRSVH